MNQQKEMKIGDIFDRLYQLEGIKNDAALAKVLGVTPQAIANSRKRDSIPYDKICAYAQTNGHSLDHVLFGNERDISGSQLKHAVSKAEMADLLYFIFHELDSELFLQEQIPEKEPFWFISSVYQEVTARLPHGVPINSDDAYELARHLAKDEIDHFRQVQAITQRNSERQEKARLNTNGNNSTSPVTQNFHSTVGQAAAGNIHNHGNKEK